MHKRIVFVFNVLKVFIFQCSSVFHNNYIIVLVWCLFRFHLRAKVHQLPRISLVAIANCAMKLQGKFTKHL